MKRKFGMHYLGLLVVGAVLVAEPVVADNKQNIPDLELGPQIKHTTQFKRQIAEYPTLAEYVNPATGDLDWRNLPGVEQITPRQNGCLTCRNVPEEQIANLLVENSHLRGQLKTSVDDVTSKKAWARFEAGRLLNKLREKASDAELTAYLKSEGNIDDFQKVSKRINKLVAIYEEKP